MLLGTSALLGALSLLRRATASPGASSPGAAGVRCAQGCVLQVSDNLSSISSIGYGLASVILHDIL